MLQPKNQNSENNLKVECTGIQKEETFKFLGLMV